MRNAVFVVAAICAIAWGGRLAAQESKPVPKDSMRVSIPGCAKGALFVAGLSTEDQPARAGIPEGMRFRMNVPKQMKAEIKAHEASMIELTGLIKRGQYRTEGVAIAPGVRITAGASPTGSNPATAQSFNQILIDVEGWRPVLGECRSR